MTIDESGGWREDERRDPRYEGRVEAFLVADGHLWRCWIRDLSLSGAGLEPAMPGVLGYEVELRSPRFEWALRGQVVNVAHRRTCLTFDLEPVARERLRAFLAENVAAG